MSSFSPRRGDRGSTIVLNSARTASNRDTLQRALQTTFDESDIDALRQIRHDIDEKICALEAKIDTKFAQVLQALEKLDLLQRAD